MIRRIIRFARYYGYGELLRRVCLSSIGSIFMKRNMFILNLEVNDISGPDSSLQYREVKRSSSQQIFNAMYFSYAHILNRFDNRERCYAVMEDNMIASYLWVTLVERKITELGLEFKLRPGQAWVYNALTFKRARGKGYYPNLVRFVAKALEKEGVCEVFIDIEEKNNASLKGAEKAGYRKIAKIRLTKVLSQSSYHVAVLNAGSWARLSEQIECCPRMITAHEEITHEN